MTRFILAAMAGMWMADGVALLIAPLFVVSRVRESLAQHPTLLRWEAAGLLLGLVLLILSGTLPYQPLWWITGGAMMLKGWLLLWGPDAWRTGVRSWCGRREAVDVRFFGLWLCTLALLLLHALGLLPRQP